MKITPYRKTEGVVILVLRHKAYRYRIDPTPEQEKLIQQTFGCCRFVFNHFLTEWNQTYAVTGGGLTYQACATQLPAMKQTHNWLKDVDSIALQSAVRHLADSFDRYFKKQNQAPLFKSRKHPVQSYTTRMTNGNIEIRDNRIKLPKLGWLRYANSRALEGRILSATVRRNAAGRYFVSIVCEVDMEPLPHNDKSIGIDVGLKEYVVCSDGMRIANPRWFRQYEQRLTFWQRRLSRRTKGGSNWRKAKQKIARIHEKIANSRNDFVHKLTTKLIRENQTISIEDLAIANMLRNPKLAKSIADASWSAFERQLAYKCDWYGRTLCYTKRFEPTSQACHVCGAIHKETKDLRVREWECPSCKTSHDRDENAAQNIKKLAV
jgi:putative transposase